MAGSQRAVDHVDICESCKAEIPVYSQRRHRHCAVCQRDEWVRTHRESCAERAPAEPDPSDTLQTELRAASTDDGATERDAVRPDYQRARSHAEKDDRRLSILAAAEAQVAEGGMDSFTMGTLSSRAGIAKGTLYLYFETKEVVLQELNQHHVTQWSSALIEATQEGMTDAAFCGVFWDCTEADLVLRMALMDLRADRNTPVDWVFEFLSRQNSILMPLARHFEHCLGLARGGGGRLLTTLWALMSGLMRMDLSRMRPDLSPDDLPHDAVGIYRLMDSKALFLRSAPALIASER